MKTITRTIAILLIGVVLRSESFAVQDQRTEPPKYRLELVYIFESNVTEFIFVVGNSGFKSVDSLKKFIANLRPGSTLEWAPGCTRLGNEPLLSSEVEMKEFKRFCKDSGIIFKLIPSG